MAKSSSSVQNIKVISPNSKDSKETNTGKVSVIESIGKPEISSEKY
jgi:hypothetical protein